MTTRDPGDLDRMLDGLRADVDDLKKTMISRWGRVPHVAVDPATLADGMDWIRSDTGEWRYRANGATVALDARYVPIAGGVLLVDSSQTIITATDTDITWSAAEVSDPDNWATIGSATLTVPAGKGGRYLICFSGAWAAQPAATCSVVMWVNAAYAYEHFTTSPGFYMASVNFSLLRTLAAGDTIKFQVRNPSGVNNDLVSRLEIAPV